jgi:acetyl esterase/lipase
MMDRRAFLGTMALTSLSRGVRAAMPAAPALGSMMALPLWPGTPPGGAGVHLTPHIDELSAKPTVSHNRIVTRIAQPVLYVFPAAAPDGSALLIIPGGGYHEVHVDFAGFEPARRFNQAGVTAFVLLYRIPSEGWARSADVPLQDAQRAIRLIKANAARFRIDAARTGVLGFSSGGHLAAQLATRANAPVYAAIDAADHEDAKPSFAALLYPVITMLPPYAHEESREMLLGTHASTDARAAYSCERLVTRATPPTFLVAATDDALVPPENTLAMFDALRHARVATELHMFERGGHGFGLGVPGQPTASWPDLLQRWGASHGFFRNVRG